MESKHAGRKYKFTDAHELQRQIEAYFDSCDPHLAERLVENGFNVNGKALFTKREMMTEQEPYTVTGLALHLGVSRQTLCDYQNPNHYRADIPLEVRDRLIDTIESAKQRVELFNEKQLHKSGISSGIKFNLTNNFGWVDRTVVENKNQNVKDDLDNIDQLNKQNAAVGDEAKKALEAEHVEQPGSPAQ